MLFSSTLYKFMQEYYKQNNMIINNQVKKCTFLTERDELYANDPCGSQFESQDIFSHLSKKKLHIHFSEQTMFFSCSLRREERSRRHRRALRRLRQRVPQHQRQPRLSGRAGEGKRCRGVFVALRAARQGGEELHCQQGQEEKQQKINVIKHQGHEKKIKVRRAGEGKRCRGVFVAVRAARQGSEELHCQQGGEKRHCRQGEEKKQCSKVRRKNIEKRLREKCKI